MPEIADLRARHHRLIGEIAALLGDFERETGLRITRATVTRDEHELLKLFGGHFTEEDLKEANRLMRGKGLPRLHVWIVPHAEM